MNTFGITEKSYRLLIDTFQKNTEVEKIIIFGSRAKGNYKKGSDIDLAVKGKNVTPELVFNLSGLINEELPLPYHVDIIEYSSLDHAELKEHINRIGIEFYKKQPVD